MYDETCDCPKCGESCDRESVHVGVGMIYGPWGCGNCGWSSSPEYDRSEGPSPAQIAEGSGRYVDCRGVSHSVERIADSAERFGVPRSIVEDAFQID